MIAIDTNVLVYAHRSDLAQHGRATTAVAQVAEGRRAWALPWPVLHEFFRVVTDPRLFKQPTPPDVAFQQLSEWLRSPSVQTIGETNNHFQTLEKFARDGFVKGAKIHDARIAAICVTNGVSELWSCDRDFTAFPKLRVVNPIVEHSLPM